MKRLVSTRSAGAVLLVTFGAMALFHVAVLSGLAPADMVWGGRAAESATRLQVLEMIALIVTLGFAGIIYLRLKDIKQRRSRKSITIGVWVMTGFFVLNTIGNLASTTDLETWLFTPLTLLVALCTFRLAIEKPGAA